MTMIRSFALSFLLLAGAAVTHGQAEHQEARQAPHAPAVTVSLSGEGVRFTALGSVGQVRLEVFDAGGASFYNSGFRHGTFIDWPLLDGQGQQPSDGAYLCVLTVRELSGRLSVKQGTVHVQGGQAALHLGRAEHAGAVEGEKSLAPAAAGSAATLTAHDGSDGLVVSTRGGLAFRAGDFFGGKDRELMRLTPGGDLGVGVAAPEAKLDVAGVIRARGGIQFDDGTVLTSAARPPKAAPGAALTAAPNDAVTANLAGTGTASVLAKWADSAGTLGNSSVAEVSGNVGIGTKTPASLLHLAGPSGVNAITLNTPGTQRFRFQTVPNIQNWGAFTLNANYNAGWNLDNTAMNGWFFKMDSRGGNAAGPNNGLWLFRIPAGPNPHTDEAAVFGITNGQAYFAGKVGIGNNAPAESLDVVGNIKVSGNAVVAGNIAAKYQDVAEWVPARERMEAGTVVILDAETPNTVAPSARAYDTRVAGVVSAQPGVILGEAGAGKVMVATTGRVRVRVDATRRPIRIGDLLVTSTRPGVAMRSRPVKAGGTSIHRPGTIIGKALEPLAGGVGEILVLLSLQ